MSDYFTPGKLTVFGLSMALIVGMWALNRFLVWRDGVRPKAAPPRDEFDDIYDRSWAAPGVFVIWIAIVRSWRGFRRWLVGQR
jgi:hypothetical protein